MAKITLYHRFSRKKDTKEDRFLLILHQIYHPYKFKICQIKLNLSTVNALKSAPAHAKELQIASVLRLVQVFYRVVLLNRAVLQRR